MFGKSIPEHFATLLSKGYLTETDILKTADGFFLVYQSLADLLASRQILDFPDSAGERLLCSSFFDDWFLYAVPGQTGHTYSLLKLREQEQDAKNGAPADGDTPGVTISFIAFDCQVLLDCLAEPTDEHRAQLNREINRVVAYHRQQHHKDLKRYFQSPKSCGAYLVAEVYAKRIASYAEEGKLAVPEAYQQLLQRSISYKNSQKFARLPSFVEKLNQAAGYTLCDSEHIYIVDPNAPTEYETAAILATHTGNTSVYSFAAEVEYHAKFLTPLTKLRLPFWGKSIYASAIRADMTVGDTEFEGPAPFHREDSHIVKRHYVLHGNNIYQKEELLP